MDSSKIITKNFNSISSYYNFMNNIISFGLHLQIKKEIIKKLNIQNYTTNLDLCCGTGDIANIIKKINKTTKVFGIDNSINMLKIAKETNDDVKFVYANAEKIPFPDNCFDNIITSFGFRNIVNKDLALSEINRVLKPNGLFLHIDFNKENILNSIYDKYILLCVRLLKKDLIPYEYLIASKKAFYDKDELIKLFENNNFSLVSSKQKALNMISYQILQKKCP